MTTRTDEEWMVRAIEIARGNPQAPFGTVIVSAGETVVAEGLNRAADHPVLHGEMVALNRLAEIDAADSDCLTLYTTAEPCPMCQAAIIYSGISRVVYGTSIPTLVELGWKQIRIRASEVIDAAPQDVQLTGGVLEAECDALFPVK